MGTVGAAALGAGGNVPPGLVDQFTGQSAEIAKQPRARLLAHLHRRDLPERISGLVPLILDLEIVRVGDEPRRGLFRVPAGP